MKLIQSSRALGLAVAAFCIMALLTGAACAAGTGVLAGTIPLHR